MFSKGKPTLGKWHSRYRWSLGLVDRGLQQIKWYWLLSVFVLVISLTGCSQSNAATRTPVPTFTPTPMGAAVAPSGAVESPAAATATLVVAMPTATETATPVPPTATPTTAPTATPPPTATFTPSPIPTIAPTATETPTPSPTPSFTFDLELAEKHPTESLAPDVVRIFLYVSDEDGVGLPGYTLRVVHDGNELTVDRVSEGGLPKVTRDEPSPYTRFTNMNIIFVESQEGEWTAQLVDSNGVAVGPLAEFELTADEVTRELYIRYRRK